MSYKILIKINTWSFVFLAPCHFSSKRHFPSKLLRCSIIYPLFQKKAKIGILSIKWLLMCVFSLLTHHLMTLQIYLEGFCRGQTPIFRTTGLNYIILYNIFKSSSTSTSYKNKSMNNLIMYNPDTKNVMTQNLIICLIACTWFKTAQKQYI